MLAYSIRFYRDLFLWQQGAAELLRLPNNELQFLKNFAEKFNFQNIESVIADLNEATYHLERNARAKMIMLDMSLTFSRLIRT